MALNNRAVLLRGTAGVGALIMRSSQKSKEVGEAASKGCACSNLAMIISCGRSGIIEFELIDLRAFSFDYFLTKHRILYGVSCDIQ